MVKTLRLLLISVFVLIIQTAIGQPTITAFNPLSGPVGTTVTITGTGFDTNKDNNIVYFGAVKATVIAVISEATPTLQVKVPAGATYRPITVTVKRLTACSSIPFVLTVQDNTEITQSSYSSVKEFPSNGSTQILFGDIDGDGRPDVINVNDTEVCVYRNISRPGIIDFAPKHEVFSSPWPYNYFQSAIADINGDGKLDLIVPESSENKISVYINKSSINNIDFYSKISFDTDIFPYLVTVVDLDRDGKLDLVVGCTSYLSILRNTTSAINTASFSSMPSVDNPTVNLHLDNVDLNRDGKPEIVTISPNENLLSVFFNSSNTDTGSISFDSPTDFPTGSGPLGLYIGCFDDDSNPDIAITNQGNYTVSVFKNTSPDNGAISFSNANFDISNVPNNLILDDLNGDGKVDLVVSVNDGTISILKNNSNTSVVIDTGVKKLWGIGVADLDGDGRPDIIAGNKNLTPGAPKLFVLRYKLARIIEQSLTEVYDKGNSLKLSVTLSDDLSDADAVRFRSKGISEPFSDIPSELITSFSKTYEKVISPADLTDPIGVVFSFQLVNQIESDQVIVDSVMGNTYIKYPATSNEQVIPDLSFGDQVSNYQIVAVPLQLTNKDVSSVFSSLVPYNKKKWRLFDYADNSTREYGDFNTIEPGKGYWLIVKSNTTINPGEGQTVEVTALNPFVINLSVGWNLIGNPYNFNVSWADVMEANPGVTGVDDKLKVFTSGALTDSDILEKYRGAFVFSDETVSIKIPVKKNTAAGRVAQKTSIVNALDQNHWEVKLTLKQGDISNDLAGIGMHPSAKLTGKDKYDEASVPMPEGLGLFELAYPHPEVFTDFSKEVVPTQENFTWNFNVNRTSNAGNIELSWANDYFGDNKKQLKLFDPSSLELIDMRKTNHFTINARTEKLIVLFGDDEYIDHALDKQLPWLGNAYPNPAKEALTIPFRVPESQHQKQVQINIYNSLGETIATPVNQILATGNYDVKWQPQHGAGLYFVKMKIGQQEAQSKKIIIE